MPLMNSSASEGNISASPRNQICQWNNSGYASDKDVYWIIFLGCITCMWQNQRPFFTGAGSPNSHYM